MILAGSPLQKASRFRLQPRFSLSAKAFERLLQGDFTSKFVRPEIEVELEYDRFARGTLPAKRIQRHSDIQRRRGHFQALQHSGMKEKHPFRRPEHEAHAVNWEDMTVTDPL